MLGYWVGSGVWGEMSTFRSSDEGSVLTFGEFVPKRGFFGVSGEKEGNSHIWGNLGEYENF